MQLSKEVLVTIKMASIFSDWIQFVGINFVNWTGLHLLHNIGEQQIFNQS